MSLTICRHLLLTNTHAEGVALAHHQPTECNHRGSGRIGINGPTLSHRGSGRVSAANPTQNSPSAAPTPQAWRGSGRVSPDQITSAGVRAWRGSGRIRAIAA